MNESAALEAFNKSAPHVELLDQYMGSIDIPKALKIQEINQLLWSRKGKRLRPHLVYWFGEIAGVEHKKLETYAWAAEAVHTATLLHDDVIDRADMRRGGPSAAKVYDNTLSVLAGDYLLGDVIYQVALQGNQENLLLLTQVMKDLCSGECLQYETRYKIPESANVFADIARLKTSSLFKWCSLVGPNLVESALRNEISDFIESFGVLFQQTDDFLDVYGTDTKAKWNDLQEGKLNSISWPMVKNNIELKSMVEEKFSKEQIDEELISLFTKISDQYLEECRAQIQELADKTIAKLSVLPESEVKAGLADLVSICAQRVY